MDSNNTFYGYYNQAVEGAFVSPDHVYTSMTAGAGALVGGVGGAALGRFGFAHVDGRVTNERTAATDRLGFVILSYTLPVLNNWQRNYWDELTCTLRVREGTVVTMLTRGTVWARFAGGAWAGQRVYASVLNGQAISGYADDAEPTPWTVQSNCAPGELAIITTNVLE